MRWRMHADRIETLDDRRYGELVASAAQIDAASGQAYAIQPSGTDMIVTTPAGEVASYNPGDMCVTEMFRLRLRGQSESFRALHRVNG